MGQPNQSQQNGYIDPFTQMMFGPPTASPPPQQQNQPANQGNNVSGMMPSFFDENGNMDFNKMMAGADQLYKVINKAGPMMKQISPLLSLFKK